MDFKAFLSRYDFEGSIVLLVGKRKVEPEDCKKLVALGERLAAISTHITFRSGNSSGSDYYFAKGVTNIDSSRMEVILPFDGYRKRYITANKTISLDAINLAKENFLISESERNIKTAKLIRPYVEGLRNRFYNLCSFIIRSTLTVLGNTTGVPAAAAGIFYDDLEYPEQGGTGHTILTCKRNAIPVYNQLVWFDWVV